MTRNFGAKSAGPAGNHWPCASWRLRTGPWWFLGQVHPCDGINHGLNHRIYGDILGISLRSLTWWLGKNLHKLSPCFCPQIKLIWVSCRYSLRLLDFGWWEQLFAGKWGQHLPAKSGESN
jgi:hypothetical protein